MTTTIPVLSVDEAMNHLLTYYSCVVKGGYSSFSHTNTFFLWGNVGVGKTQMVKEFTKRLGKMTGKKTDFLLFDLLIKDLIELSGLPYLKTMDDGSKCTAYAPLSTFYLDPDPEKIHVIFVDELTANEQQKQKAALSIVLERRIGDLCLPDNTIIIAAGNRTKDKTAAFGMVRALSNRFCHFEIVPDFDSWYSWATKNGINHYVIDYLSLDRTKLYEQIPGSESFATPRSWEFVSDFLNQMHKPPADLRIFIQSAVGSAIANEFIAWSKTVDADLDVESIVNGTRIMIPNQPDLAYTLRISLEQYVKEHPKMSHKKLSNICRFIGDYPLDHQTGFFSSILKNNADLSWKLQKIPEYLTWKRRCA